MTSNSKDLVSIINQLIIENQISHWGISPSTKPLSFEFYHDWINKNVHGDMTYLNEHLWIKEDLKRIYTWTNSLFSFAHPYRALQSNNKTFLKSLNVALYAQDEDYHLWFKNILQDICSQLKVFYPDDFFVPFTDSVPVLERDFGFQSRLGWFGKNSCLIHPKFGSLFLIGNIISSLKIEHKPSTLPDFCGKCTRCISACPTSAILHNKTIKATDCISYLTIESRSVPPENLRPLMGDHFFGCDICQTVCPWNQKILNQLPLFPKNKNADDNDTNLTSELRFFLNSSGKEIEKKIKNSPLIRARPFGLKRNALIVIGNLKLHSLKKDVEKYITHPRLSELALWTLSQLS